MASNHGKPSWLKQALGPLPYSKDLRKALEIREDDCFFEVYQSRDLVPNESYETVSEYSRQRHHFPHKIRLYPIGAETDVEKQWMSTLISYLRAFIHPVCIEVDTLEPLVGHRLKLFTLPDGHLHGSNILQAMERSTAISADILHVGCSFKPLSCQLLGESSKGTILVEVLNASLASIAKNVLFQWGKMKPCCYFKCALNPVPPSAPFCLCVVCLRKLSTAAPRFDPKSRYEELCKIYQQIGATMELRWVAER